MQSDVPVENIAICYEVYLWFWFSILINLAKIDWLLNEISLFGCRLCNFLLTSSNELTKWYIFQLASISIYIL